MALIRKIFLGGFFLGLINPMQLSFAASDVVDGFFAYCTGNNDSTGLCRNEETGRDYTCQVIPGAVIDCMSSRSKPFQCVWISAPIANAAEFWCDKNVDQMLRDEFKTTITEKEFKSGTAAASSSSINDQEFDGEVEGVVSGASVNDAEFMPSDAPSDAIEDQKSPGSNLIKQAETQIRIEQSAGLGLDPADIPLIDLRSPDYKKDAVEAKQSASPSQEVVDGIEAQLRLEGS